MSNLRVATALRTDQVDVLPFEVSDAQAQNIVLSDEISRLKIRLVELERSADTDPLVNVYNRRAFMRELGRAQAVNARYDIPCCVIFFDLDGFKLINDSYGHAVGDELLMQIANCFTAEIRQCDVVARLGGDEFGIILFKTELDMARAKATALALKISELQIDHKSGPVSVTTSWGVAPCDSDQTPKQILSRADRAMYTAKNRRKETIDLTFVS